MNQMPNVEARTRKLKFWLFGIFVLAFASVTAVLGAISGGSLGLVFGEVNYWLMIAIVAVLCVIAYFVLNRVGQK